jgi:predicted  nucleic acid-binding Zn-ribbon protein
MPGVSAVEGKQIIDNLREVSQITSQETSKLVDAIAHLTIDSDDTDRSIARMSLDHNLVKATSEDTIQKLKQELGVEREKRVAAETEAASLSKEMETLKGEFEEFRDRVENGMGGSPDTQNAIVKVLCMAAVIALLTDLCAAPGRDYMPPRRPGQQSPLSLGHEA